MCYKKVGNKKPLNARRREDELFTPEKGGCQAKFLLLGIYYEKVLIKSVTLICAFCYLVVLVYEREMSKKCFRREVFLN